MIGVDVIAWKWLHLLAVCLTMLSMGCTAAIDLDERISETMARHFSRNAFHRNFRVACSPGLRSYVYQGYPKGLTGSEVTATIPLGETFCALIDQVESALEDQAANPVEIVLALERISFTYSYKGTALWAEEGRDFDAAYLLVGLNAVSASRFREYILMSEKERFESADMEDPRKYAVVNSVLEDVIMQLYSKIYRDF